jgi:hypothetical protein
LHSDKAGLDMLWVFQETEAPRLQDNRHMKVVRLSSLRTGRLYPPGNIPAPHFFWSFGVAIDYGLDGRGSNTGGGEIFRACPDRPWGPPSLQYNGHRVFPGGKMRPGRAADHPPPSSAEVMEE